MSWTPGAGRFPNVPLVLTLGFACAWWHPREQTWSYTAARLRRALEEHAAVVDIEAQRSLAGKVTLRAAHAPLRGVPWKYSTIERALIDRAVRRAVGRRRLDAVLGVAEADTVTDVPTFLYQDMNAAIALSHQEDTGQELAAVLPSRPAVLSALAAHQLGRLHRAHGVFAMSQWYADLLVDRFGVDRDRVWVAPAGMNNPPARRRDPHLPPTGRLLFVGTEFERKGGDVVLEAARRLRLHGRDDVVLTVVGPDRWPLAGSPPAWVDFRGRLSPADVSAMLPTHDLFVMPSRFEPFGIAFVEALAAGLPCVARRDFAMPEIVQDGVTGALVSSDDPDELATAVEGLLDDRDVYERVSAAIPDLVARHDWSAVASSMVRRISNVVAST
jgi:glycosyltransferase involved in cell wall biosynthesis